MRKVILYIASSLDGYIAGTNGDLDWLDSFGSPDDFGYREFISTIDTVVMGCKTYDDVLRRHPGEYFWPDQKSYVFSRTRAGETDYHAEFVAPEPAEFVRRLRTQPGKNIFLVGGGEMIKPFVEHDLIDEYVIGIFPVVLGAGTLLFATGIAQTWLRLKKCTTYDSGVVELTYVPTHMTTA